MHNLRFAVLSSLLVLSFVAGPAQAHDQSFAIEGGKLSISTKAGPTKAKFNFKVSKQITIAPLHDPGAVGSSVLVRGTGDSGLDQGKTTRISLDESLWKGLGKPAGVKGYKYIDKSGSRGGITKVTYKLGQLNITAKGANWQWDPLGPQDETWVHFFVEEEAYCARFGGIITSNEAGSIKAKKAPSPVTCPQYVCGNAVVELGEGCDDGNLEEDDGCNNDCTIGLCDAPSFDSTFEGIQQVIFEAEVYGCTASFCHGGTPGDPTSGQGSLNLGATDAYEALMGADATGADSPNFVGVKRVLPGDLPQSLLYEKLAASTLGSPITHGSPMPSGGGVPLTTQHLEAIDKWIRGGAPEDLVVAGTAGLLGTCLPATDPLTIPPPDPPVPGEGVQLRSTAWDLPGEFENEICFATHYDFTVTSLVPASALVPCPRAFRSKVCDDDETIACLSDDDCSPAASCVTFTVCRNSAEQCSREDVCPGSACVENNPNNPENQCFAYHRNSLSQDPQSHHSFIRMYLGQFLTDDSGWGDWTYKFADQSNPLQGMSCDPLAVDPVTGYHDGCSSEVVEAVACLGYGPVDFGDGAGPISSGTAPTFSGSPETYVETEYADGVFSVLPMQGLIVWNSHAFNLTPEDSTMSQYFNMYAAAPADQLFPVQGIADIASIFVQDVPPFESREYCRTYTIPENANLFSLTSHFHRHGVLWRTWAPPNTPCVPGEPACVPDDGVAPLYINTVYNDPLVLKFDPPVLYDDPDVEDRTFLYCAVYDNGETPASPGVKRQSTSPVPPLVFGLPLAPGGPCSDDEVACMDGPQKGELCFGEDANCTGSICDACPLRGGVATEDEMFILYGSFYTTP